MARVSHENLVKCMFTGNYGLLFRLQMDGISRSTSPLDV